MKKLILTIPVFIFFITFYFGIFNNYKTESLKESDYFASIFVHHDIKRYPFLLLAGNPCILNLMIKFEQEFNAIEASSVIIFGENGHIHDILLSQSPEITYGKSTNASIAFMSIDLPESDFTIKYDLLLKTKDQVKEYQIKFSIKYIRAKEFGNHFYDMLQSV